MTKPHYTIKFPDLAVAACQRLMEKAHEKHKTYDTGEKEDKRDVDHHVTHAADHMADFVCGQEIDPEYGEHNLVHAACRLLMVVDLMERERIERGWYSWGNGPRNHWKGDS